MRCALKTLISPFILYFKTMTATLDMPVDVAIAALRVAGTGDNLLAALDALVTVTPEQDQDEVTLS